MRQRVPFLLWHPLTRNKDKQVWRKALSDFDGADTSQCLCTSQEKEKMEMAYKKKNNFFQACCYIFLSCEVDSCEVDSSVNIYLSNGSCLIEMGIRFYFEKCRFHNHFFSTIISHQRDPRILCCERQVRVKSAPLTARPWEKYLASLNLLLSCLGK